MAGAVGDAGHAQVALHQVGQAVVFVRLAVVGEEQGPVVRTGHQPGAHFGKVARHPVSRTLPQRDEAVAPPLALADHDGAAFELEFGQLQARGFRAPHAGAVQEFQQRAVAHAGETRHVRLRQRVFHLRHG